MKVAASSRPRREPSRVAPPAASAGGAITATPAGSAVAAPAVATAVTTAIPITGEWHEEVRRFKRGLLTSALRAAGGNRTHSARALGLQRTYLLRLIRELDVDIAPPPRGRRPAE